VSRPVPIELPSQYAPAEVEGPRYERWEKAGYFTADASRIALEVRNAVEVKAG
jgi:hypothetical protein